MSTQSETVRRYAAIMFTDIVGFSKIAQRDENLTIELLDEHYAMLRGIFGGHGGREIKTIGDAFMVEFTSPLAAVRSAVDIQKALYERNKKVPGDRIVNVRIGIHAGEVMVRGNDLFGNGVNIAARIEPQSPPGGVAVSAHVRETVAAELGMDFEKMDVVMLKNIEKQVDLFRVVLQDGEPAGVMVRRAIEGERLAEPEGRGRLTLLGRVAAGCDPLAVPIVRAEQAHRPVGRLAPGPLSAVLVPEPNFPGVGPPAGQGLTGVGHVGRLGRRDLAAVPHVGVRGGGTAPGAVRVVRSRSE